MKGKFFWTIFLASVLFVASCAGGEATPTPPPSEPLRLANLYYQAFNARDVEALKAIFADDAVFSVEGSSVKGRAAVVAGHTGGEFPLNPQITLSNPRVQGNMVRGDHSWRADGFGLLTATIEIVAEDGQITSLRVTLDEESRQRVARASLPDPSFQPLEGARAMFGQLEESVYRIEVPSSWNRRLLLWTHGFEGVGPNPTVEPPPLREYLIENGYAWAVSSFTPIGHGPSFGAQETAALHDLFIREFGQPDYTYISGESLGGYTSLVSLERFPRRYEGALALCSGVGLPTLDYFGHYVVLGAYAAGVTQREFDPAESVTELVRERILPTLTDDPHAGALFERLVISLTGGPRPFRREGFERYYNLVFYNVNFMLYGRLAMEGAHFDNTDFVYPGAPARGVSAEEVNARVVRIRADPKARAGESPLTALAGAVPVPVLMLHTTGDGLIPFSGMQQFRRLADAAGNGDLLVQRAIRAPGHCDFTPRERIAALEDLVNWVEEGAKAEGEDILAPLQDVGLKFTDPLRGGDPGGL